MHLQSVLFNVKRALPDKIPLNSGKPTMMVRII